jgi:hypothetical protein
MGTEGTRGILSPSLGLTQFTLERELPPDDLAPFVERFWRVSRTLEQGVFEREILPYPCVNLPLGAQGCLRPHPQRTPTSAMAVAFASERASWKAAPGARRGVLVSSSV